MTNRTFSKMAAEVDAALQHYRDQQSIVTSLEEELAKERARLDEARDDLNLKRDELFEAHPELAPPRAAPPAPDTWQPPGSGVGFEPVEVDDPDELPDFREMP